MVLKLRMHQNHLEGLPKCTLLGPTPGVSDSAGLRRSLRICTSNESPSDTDTASQGATLVNHWTHGVHVTVISTFSVRTLYMESCSSLSLSHSLFARPAATTLIQLITPRLLSSWNALCLLSSDSFSYYNFQFKCYLWEAFPDLLVISNAV